MTRENQEIIKATSKLNIAIAGASGFVGRHLVQILQEGINKSDGDQDFHNFHILSLGRGEKTKIDNDNNDFISHRQVDLYSFQSTLKALAGADIAIYLVHSMMPATTYFQGDFKDTDLLLADNFARACKACGVKQIIYLGGIIPEGELSHHLQSRLEVEEVFKNSGIKTTIFRAGMVVGDEGSSYQILKNLILNLPLMVLPLWTKNLTKIIYIDDLIKVIKHSILNEDYFNRNINLVTDEEITYGELIKKTAKYFKKSNFSLSVPVNYLSLSKLWVKYFGESNIELVSPLIDSLQCNFSQIKPTAIITDLITYKTYDSMLLAMKNEGNKSKKHARFKKNKEGQNTVRSIQRLSSDEHISLNERQISDLYFNWLPQKFNGFIYAKKSRNNGRDVVEFKIKGLDSPLLILQKIDSHEALDRVKFHIIGGFLTKTNNTGWLEFRFVAGKYTLASINEFVPSLPWWIYRLTQAPMHLYVMHEFGKKLIGRKLKR